MAKPNSDEEFYWKDGIWGETTRLVHLTPSFIEKLRNGVGNYFVVSPAVDITYIPDIGTLQASLTRPTAIATVPDFGPRPLILPRPEQGIMRVYLTEAYLERLRSSRHKLDITSGFHYGVSEFIVWVYEASEKHTSEAAVIRRLQHFHNDSERHHPWITPN